MKEKSIFLNPFLMIAVVIAVSFIFCNNTAFALNDDVPERLKYFKEKYEEDFEADFDKVWQTLLKFLEENDCQIFSQRIRENDKGLQRGILQSDLCILTQNRDSTFRVIRKYALDPPFIRGGVWIAVRMKYRFIADDLGNGKINVVLSGEMSGFENHATFRAHDFRSNGLLEFMAFERIREMLGS